jgi:hypothetical protein
MSLGSTNFKTYLNLKKGKIYHDDKTYDYVEGYLKGIEAKERTFRGELVKYWYVNIQSLTGDYYSLSIPYHSGAAKSLFNSLASAESFTEPVKILAYTDGHYTKVSTYLGDKKLNWKAPLPALEEINVGTQTIRDDSKRMEYIVNLVNEINTKI